MTTQTCSLLQPQVRDQLHLKILTKSLLRSKYSRRYSPISAPSPVCSGGRVRLIGAPLWPTSASFFLLDSFLAFTTSRGSSLKLFSFRTSFLTKYNNHMMIKIQSDTKTDSRYIRTCA